jgi:hypothetical protein
MTHVSDVFIEVTVRLTLGSREDLLSSELSEVVAASQTACKLDAFPQRCNVSLISIGEVSCGNDGEQIY